MALMCRIDSIPPQIEKAGEQVSQIAGATSQWSSIVFPCVVLNQASKACLQVYREWKEAQETGVGQDEEEPALFVGVIQVTQVLHWSGSSVQGVERGPGDRGRPGRGGACPVCWRHPGDAGLALVWQHYRWRDNYHESGDADLFGPVGRERRCGE